MPNQYLFLLGRNYELSKTELLNFCEEVFASETKALFIGKNLKFENPRNLPKSPEQLFLDRLGGTVRMAEVMDEIHSRKALCEQIFQFIKAHRDSSSKPKLGISAFGAGGDFLKSFLSELKQYFADHHQDIRLENSQGKNLTSGQIFDRKLLKKGEEFIIWKNENSFLLARTVANQNLRNYTLRDRAKPFRDAKMGMLPPKLAQIMINFAKPNLTETIIDPFCGSGTVNAEAAIMGYGTVGSDSNEHFLAGARENFDFLAGKFRYPPETGTFFVSEAENFPYEKHEGVVVTEGFLGTNFEAHPSRKDIAENEAFILSLWEKIFDRLAQSSVRKVVFCLPCWNFQGQKISISEKLFAKISKNSYIARALFGGQKTFVYEREGAYVGREICVIERM